MKELIDKGVLIKDWKKLPVQKVELVSCDDIYRNRPLCDLALVYEMITNAQTTTEAEIRAKALGVMGMAMKEFYPSCKGAYVDFDVFFHAVMARVAEQLKEE